MIPGCLSECHSPCLFEVWLSARPFSSLLFCLSFLLCCLRIFSVRLLLLGQNLRKSRLFIFQNTSCCGAFGCSNSKKRKRGPILLADLYATYSLRREGQQNFCDTNAKPLFLSKRGCFTRVYTQAVCAVYVEFLPSSVSYFCSMS